MYRLFRGDLRGTLGALEQAAIRLIGLAGESPADPMGEVEVRAVLRSVYTDEIEASVGNSDVELLQGISRIFADGAFTQAEVEEQNRVPLATAPDAFGRLVPQGFIVAAGKREGSGPGRRPIEYVLSGAVRVTFT